MSGFPSCDAYAIVWWAQYQTKRVTSRKTRFAWLHNDGKTAGRCVVAPVWVFECPQSAVFEALFACPTRRFDEASRDLVLARASFKTLELSVKWGRVSRVINNNGSGRAST